MKILILSAVFLLVNPTARGQGSTPDFKCVSSKTGMTYLIFFRKFTEVRYVSPDRSELVFGHRVGFDIQEFNTSPKTFEFNFYDQANGSIAVVRKFKNSVRFQGNDDAAVCTEPSHRYQY